MASLLLVVRPGATSSILAFSSKAIVESCPCHTPWPVPPSHTEKVVGDKGRLEAQVSHKAIGSRMEAIAISRRLLN